MTDEFYGSVRMEMTAIQKELQRRYLTFKLEGPWSSEETSLPDDGAYKATVWEIGHSNHTESVCNVDPLMALIRAAEKFLSHCGKEKKDGKQSRC